MVEMNNPMFDTDMPDPDIIRVGDTYYLVSTTMFFMPSTPILKSKDLCHWEIVSYVCDQVEDHENYRLEQGKHGYGKGQWATSLRYYKGKFYACFVCHDMGKTFLFSTDDIEKSNWDKVVIDEVFHDMSFLFWEDRVFLVYGNGEIEIVELKEDLSGVKEGGLRKVLIETQKEGIGLRAEGCRAIVKDGMIYLFFIDWPKDSVRREICYRSAFLEGPYERKVLMEYAGDRPGRGIAQGTMIDTVNGDWYALLFQDRGASGRIPFLMPAGWEDGWPVLGCLDEDKVPYVPKTVSVNLPLYEVSDSETLRSNQFAELAKVGEEPKYRLKKCWQWNHNPLPEKYSLDAVSGGLRLLTGPLATGLLDARNTLTQRTVEPGCSCKVRLDYENLKVGDFAGICAFQGKYGQLGVEKTEEGTRLLLKQKKGESYGVGKIVPDKEAEFETWSQTLENGNSILLRIDFDYSEDIAKFYYSTEGENWTALGDELKMCFTLDMFVGYRIGLFCYATKTSGGYADFTEFEML